MRKAVSRATWDRIRKKVYADYGHHCSVCQASGRLNCHEIWEYDDQNQVQTLRGFVALCDWCHHVKHIGLAGILASQGSLDYEKVVAHFMRVNECSREAFEEHVDQAMGQWAARSRHPWRVDLGEYESMVEHLPDQPKGGKRKP
jgi:hypothetical protein